MRRLLLLIAVLFVCSCGGGAGYAPVSGKVTLDGKALPNAVITFQPIAGAGGDAGGMGSTGKTAPDGTYTLAASTVTPRLGALIGKHKVRISISSEPQAAADTNDDAINTGPKSKIRIPRETLPARYNEQTTLEFVVPPGGSTTADFNLESK
jgi:hypothetical protein